MPDSRPVTSTVRNALAIIGAVEDLLRPGREGTVLDADTAVEAVDTIVREARDLRWHQVDDVLEFLRARLDEGALSPVAQPIRVWQIEGKGDEHPVPEAEQFGDRVEDGGVMGTIVRCQECGGSGMLHEPDERPPHSEPNDDTSMADYDGWSNEDPPGGPEPGATQPESLDAALLDHDGKDERVTAAVDELAARVNREQPS